MTQHRTAKILGAFHRELVSEGFDTDQAYEITRRAAELRIRENGIVVWEDEIND